MCMCFLFNLYVFIQTLWALYFYKFKKDWFKRHKFLLRKDVQNNLKYPECTRDDYKNWNVVEFYLVGIFIFPWRLITHILIMAVAFITLFISSKILRIDINKEQPKYFSKFVSLVIAIGTQLML